MTDVVRLGVVEDSDEDYGVLRRLLGSDPDISRWSNAEEALETLSDGSLESYAIVFVDCHLPGMDGIDLIRNLRGCPGGDHTKIVMLSGSHSLGVEDRALDAGVDRFERKGDSLADLKAAVARTLTLLKPPTD